MVLPHLNWDADRYENMIVFDSETITEPPLTQDLSDLSFKELIDSPLTIEPFPCHSQSVERHVKLIKESSKQVYGEEERDGHIRSKLASREQVPFIKSKKDWVIS